MDLQGQDCLKCNAVGTVEVDPIDGILICQSCGHVADDNELGGGDPSDYHEFGVLVENDGGPLGALRATWDPAIVILCLLNALLTWLWNEQSMLFLNVFVFYPMSAAGLVVTVTRALLTCMETVHSAWEQ